MIRKFQRLKNKKGFTLVEVIIVLVILAILAAVLIPSLTGYIDKADEKAFISEARAWYLAAQTAASENYGRDTASFREAFDATKTSFYVTTIDEEGNENIEYTKAIRISNYLFNKMQGIGTVDEENINKKLNEKDKNGLYYKAFLAADVLRYNECLNDKRVYNFATTNVFGADAATATKEGFFTKYPKENIALNVYIGRDGSVIMLQYARKDHPHIVEYTSSGFRVIDKVHLTGSIK